ncbi:ferredoxin--NADP reductase [Actinomadura parmotrematis]|uniref:Ferredoxin--NADP reductase n=1 Tax=Actinomadura parmotrematis TaxID=2864039 RepID=A0ABS7FQM4_9ACTN|nr:ferredoxin--NADP reductase [Actinomadura parmotrematis]MBW8482676.1 ferredoxin--NADP reductase [Actinomadura parmotrematis]
MARDHGFHPVRVVRVVEETADARTYVLDAPFPYRAGQFVTVRVRGALRSYSMSSSPDADTALATTVKRVPGGLVSNWMIDNLGPGDVVEMTRPAGVFCLRETAAPLVAFCGGSGVTPVLSLAKSALAAQDRRVRLLIADRDAAAVIFGAELADLAARHPSRFEVVHHLDDRDGLVTPERVRAFVGADTGADVYICGPGPFMDLTERALLAHGVPPEQIFIERFAGPAAPAAPPAEVAEAAAAEGDVTIVLGGRRHTVPQHPGETLLQSARRAGLAPPFSCEAGNCATCMARVTDGEAKMRVNDALDEDEVDEGWILTCQGEPTTPHVTVVYED